MECASTYTISAEQIQFFQQNGYLVLENVLLEQEIAQISSYYKELFEIAANLKNGDFFSLSCIDTSQTEFQVWQLMNCSRYIPNILKADFFDKCVHISQQLLGEQCSFKHDFAICKPALSQGITPWHQDNAYLRNDFDYNNINIWIPLQAVDQTNGCMRYIPGDINQQEILPHYRMNHDPRIEGLQCDVDESKAVSCPLHPGSIVIHHTKTLHSSGPNDSNASRKAYILEFETPPHKRLIPHQFDWAKTRKTQRQKEYRSLSTRLSKTSDWLSRRARNLFQ